MRALQAADAPVEELTSVLREVVSFLETLPEGARPEWRRALQFLYLLIQHMRTEEEVPMLVQAVEAALEPKHRAEVEEIEMTGAQALEAKGRREGRRELFVEQLVFKFGPLDEETLAVVNALTETQLTDIAKRMLTASSLADLGLWSQTYGAERK